MNAQERQASPSAMYSSSKPHRKTKAELLFLLLLQGEKK